MHITFKSVLMLFIKIIPCLSKLELAKVSALFETVYLFSYLVRAVK